MDIKKLFSGSLQFRMTVLLLAAVIPPMLIGILVTSWYAGEILRKDAKKELADKGKNLAKFVGKWEESKTLALRNLSQQPDVIGMDPAKQKAILTKMLSVYKNSTLTATDTTGKVISTSDKLDTSNYRDREWFKGAIAGKTITRQTLISRTTNKPRLCLSTPVRGDKAPRPIQGVVVSCTDLTEVAKEVGTVSLGKTGYAFLVDNKGTVIAHPDPSITAKLLNVSTQPAVKALLDGKRGNFSFTDQGTNWLSYIIPLQNGWGVVVKQQESEVLEEATRFGQLASVLAVFGALAVGGITWWLASTLVRPIKDLTVEAKAISTGNLDRRVKIDREDELGTLGVAFNKMAEQLQELIDVQVKSAMARSEIEKGRQIQKDFLPETLPQPEGWEIAAVFEPARQVAGDFYDSFPLVDGKIGVVIADVCDKGVGSALFMALFRSLIRAIAQQDYSDDRTALKNAMEFTNNYIATNHSRTNMFATMFFGVFDPKTGELNYVNGGHEPPIIMSPDGTKIRLKPTGPAVGMLPNLKFKVEQAQLKPGDILVSYTDGVPEAKDTEAQFFTEKQLLSLLEQPIASALSLLETIEAKVKQHIGKADQFDDITMLAVRRSQEK
ncbi:SpoIIE family protein phosphatase [Aerosakkonema sp. BLCC-F183]|uniref:SpoIIE family protein phosphatase n=1 Tax=Aerosakkonema sp. BLCC-F183 TaxID=3342834 RepID=UPI0035BB6BF7